MSRSGSHLPAPDRLIPQKNKTEIHTEHAACRLHDPFQHAFKAVWSDGADVLPDGMEGFHLADVAGDPRLHFLHRPGKTTEFVSREDRNTGRRTAPAEFLSRNGDRDEGTRGRLCKQAASPP